jgi:phenylpropionate dioxygenase-like ring-hydroxylating dioxygenase large terminal subunit
MFVHRTRLDQLLTGEEFCSQEQYDVEIDRLFLPIWHPAAVAGELPRDGDFKTLELYGHPILLRNDGGRIHAYLNVCAHRHCSLTDDARGNSPALTCQYHGWQYDAAGRVNHVPDGGCFKPFDRQRARLQCLRVATCGSVIFVALRDDVPPLRTFLGEVYDRVEQSSTAPWRQNLFWEHAYDANWKLPVENTVETYHLSCLHPRSLGVYPTEASQTHVLDDAFSTLRMEYPDDIRIRAQKLTVFALGGPPAGNEYVHHLIYPNLLLTFTDLFLHDQTFIPTSPTTSRSVLWMFARRNVKFGPLPRLAAAMVARAGARLNARIMREDLSVFAGQQRGKALGGEPGMLGTREERIYAFQEFVRRRCGAPGARDTRPVAAVNARRA